MIFRIHEAALREIEIACDYFDQERVGLADEFRHEVGLTIQRIMEHPTAWPPISQTLRHCFTRRFQYHIVYRARKDEVFVLAIGHTSRRPRYWRERLK